MVDSTQCNLESRDRLVSQSEWKNVAGLEAVVVLYKEEVKSIVENGCLFEN